MFEKIQCPGSREVANGASQTLESLKKVQETWATGVESRSYWARIRNRWAFSSADTRIDSSLWRGLGGPGGIEGMKAATRFVHKWCRGRIRPYERVTKGMVRLIAKNKGIDTSLLTPIRDTRDIRNRPLFEWWGGIWWDVGDMFQRYPNSAIVLCTITNQMHLPRLDILSRWITKSASCVQMMRQQK